MWLAEKSSMMAEPGGGSNDDVGLFSSCCFFFFSSYWLGLHRADRYSFHGLLLWKKILTSLSGLQQWVVVGCKPGCRLVGATQHIWHWLLLLPNFCSPTIPWELPACSLWFCSTNKALFIRVEKESELIWATGWEWSYGLMPVQLLSTHLLLCTLDIGNTGTWLPSERHTTAAVTCTPGFTFEGRDNGH